MGTPSHQPPTPRGCRQRAWAPTARRPYRLPTPQLHHGPRHSSWRSRRITSHVYTRGPLVSPDMPFASPSTSTCLLICYCIPATASLHTWFPCVAACPSTGALPPLTPEPCSTSCPCCPTSSPASSTARHSVYRGFPAPCLPVSAAARPVQLGTARAPSSYYTCSLAGCTPLLSSIP